MGIRCIETVEIIGSNTNEKFTLFQMILETLSPTDGNIQSNDRIAGLLGIGSGFNPDFSGRENVYMNRAVLGSSRNSIDQRFDSIVDFDCRSGIGLR